MSGKTSGGRFSPDFARSFSLAFEFAGAVVLFWLLGRLVDNWLDIEPWGQVAGSVFGWIGGILHVYYATRSSTGSAPPPVGRRSDRSVDDDRRGGAR